MMIIIDMPIVEFEQEARESSPQGGPVPGLPPTLQRKLDCGFDCGTVPRMGPVLTVRAAF